MFDFIRAQFKVGDVITLVCVSGTFSGTIVFINEESIILKTPDNRVCGVKGSDISFFETPSSDSLKSGMSNGEVKQDTITDQPNGVLGVCQSKETPKPISTEDVKTKPIESFKPGDVIPLDRLKKLDPKYDSRFKGGKTKMRSLQGGLEALAPLVQDIHDADNQKQVPPMGVIKWVDSYRPYGFIKDSQTNEDLYFNFNSIIDKELEKTLVASTPVVYSISKAEMGLKAICIHLPKKICDLLVIAKELSEKEEYKSALEIVNHILKEYPDNFDAGQMEAFLNKMLPSYQKKPLAYSGAYMKAKQYHAEKKYEKAIEYYEKAIENEERLESAIKDLGSLYGSLYKAETDPIKKEERRQIAIEFMKKNVGHLSESASSLNFLESFYYTIRDFDSFIPIVNTLLEEEDAIKDKKRTILLLCKKAAAYLQMSDFEEAREVIDECLRIDPNSQAALKLKNILLEGVAPNDIESIFSANEFETLTSGLSPFIEQTINGYEEYAGLQAKVIESGNFDAGTLKGLRGLIERFRGRHRERAKYLLTEAKLMMEIEPNDMTRFRSVMARYCNSMALNHISDNSPMDITRFYFNESFALEQSWEKISRQVALFFYTFTKSYGELLNIAAAEKRPNVGDALNEMMAGDFDARKWESVLSILLYNSEISARITSQLYSDAVLKSKSLLALKHFGRDVNRINTKDAFVSEWNAARDKRLRDYKNAILEIKSIGEIESIEEMAAQLYHLRTIQADWMPALDIRRINYIINDITPAVENYVRSSGYRNKLTNYGITQAQIQQLIDDININEGPTKISYEAVYPLLSRIQTALKESFDEVVKMSEPKIAIKLLSSNTVVDADNIVSIQVSIDNDKDSSPISEVSVSVNSSKDVKYIPEDNTSYNAIEGGESGIFKVRVRVSDSVIKSKATAIDARCHYKTGGNIKEVKDLLSLKLYSPDEFKHINNPYAPLADGGPVPLESDMFFGRDEFIANIVKSIIESPSKQVIIYGQKRCGKSSVMVHLKEQLQKTGKTFCIFFSLGEIIQNLTEATFYHKILSSIIDELENLVYDGLSVPVFSIPRLSEFKAEDEDNPLNTFTSYMAKFKRACKMTPGWEDKNLVVMIDEFTYLYTEIKKERISPSIMKQWKAVTQNEKAQFSVVLVGQDVVPTFKKEDYARNAFGVIQDIRLTYLQEAPARDLIEKPILDENGNSRYIGNAVSRIIDYTSRNPYYIQIFCARLVDYMNTNKSITVTVADVNDVAKSFIVGDQALEEDKFDNLIRAGETEDLQEYPESEIISVLREIAIGSKNIGYCSRNNIEALEDTQRENDILKHLVDREVLEKKGEDNYRIQVKLFQEWLLNH